MTLEGDEDSWKIPSARLIPRQHFELLSSTVHSIIQHSIYYISICEVHSFMYCTTECVVCLWYHLLSYSLFRSNRGCDKRSPWGVPRAHGSDAEGSAARTGHKRRGPFPTWWAGARRRICRFVSRLVRSWYIANIKSVVSVTLLLVVCCESISW